MQSTNPRYFFRFIFFCALILTTQYTYGQSSSSEGLVLNNNYSQGRDFAAIYKKAYKENPNNLTVLMYNIDQVVKYYSKAQKDMRTANKATKSYYESQINKQLPIAKKIKKDLLEKQRMQREIDSLDNSIKRLKNLDNDIQKLLKKAKEAKKK